MVIKGMKEKKVWLKEEKERSLEKELEKRKGWEAVKWVEKVDDYQMKSMEAEKRKAKGQKTLPYLGL